MGHLISTALKKQILWWQWYSFVAPVLFTIFSIMFYFQGVTSVRTIIEVGAVIFGMTCLAWWHWCLFTMIKMLSIMKDTDEHFETVTGELAALRLSLEKEYIRFH